ncbi:MAG: AAA family ATPase [Aliarcobacter sp.]|nr:AAA family ATPase [Aliarcobacter sp.]
MAIEKIKIHNFKKFKNLEIKCNSDLNLLIGDNESGKSTILQSIDFVLSGSRHKLENIGLESLFNRNIIVEFFDDKKFENLPSLFIELYLSEQHNPDLNGAINSSGVICDGLQVIIEPDEELSREIGDILAQTENNFPYEYYKINFITFSGERYTGYKRYIKHLVIDSSQINNEYATREYIKNVYYSALIGTEKNKHFNEYRKYKDDYTDNILADVNSRFIDNKLIVQTNTKSNLEADLNISDCTGVTIDNKGKGQQCFIKTHFALNLRRGVSELDLVLLEEPENHLSHINMHKLIQLVRDTHDKQIFLTTHSSLISTRLNLKKSILLNSNVSVSLQLEQLPEATAKFFMKAPDNNILEYVLSKKVILVEGDAEFILMEALYKKITNEELSQSDVHILSVDGTSFKRYLDIARLLGIKTAVIRDNDTDYEENIINRYKDYVGDNIKVFADNDNTRSTFEICMYQNNTRICDELFSGGRRSLSVQEYMLKNKADVAFELLDKKAIEINVPEYIKEAIEWIKE